MPPQQHDPNARLDMSQFDKVPITDSRIKQGAIIWWAGTECPIDRVTRIGSMHTCINYLYNDRICTGTFANWQDIQVKRTEQGSETDERAENV